MAVLELAESEIPAPVTVDVKLAQCEDGEHVAEKLSAVALKEEVPEEDVIAPRLTPDGALVFTRGQKVDGGMPKPYRGTAKTHSYFVDILGIGRPSAAGPRILGRSY